jgi:hypothetical protein
MILLISFPEWLVLDLTVAVAFLVVNLCVYFETAPIVLIQAVF